MNYSISKCLLITFALTVSSFCNGSTYERHILVQNVQQSAETTAFIEEAWAELAPQIQAMDEAIELNGFALVSKELVEFNIAFLDSLVLVPNLDESAIDLGYTPIDLDGREIRRAKLIGAGSKIPSQDGLTYSIVRKFKHPILGIIYLDEYAFATDPDVGTYAVRKAKGNILVNGIPATVTPLQAPDGTGKTTVKYYSDTVMYSVYVMKSIPIGSSEFHVLESFVQALY